MRNRIGLGVILVVWSILSAAPAHADPITISSGFISIGTMARGVYRTAIFDVASDAFVANGRNIDVNTGVVPACNQFVPCVPGQTVEPSVPFRFSLAMGTATVNGTEHPLTRTAFAGSFTSGRVSIPDNPGDRFTLSAPFSLAGVFDIWAIDFDPVTQDAVHTQLGLFDTVGSGTALITASRFGEGWEFSSIALNFETAASPTPEPGSLLLLGTGAVLAWRRMRHPKSSNV